MQKNYEIQNTSTNKINIYFVWIPKITYSITFDTSRIVHEKQAKAFFQ